MNPEQTSVDKPEPAPGSTITDEVQKVWRYLSFSRFVWMLQKKQLWFSRIDLLGDPWELTLSGQQLAHVLSTAPITPIDKYRLQTAEVHPKILSLATPFVAWRSEALLVIQQS